MTHYKQALQYYSNPDKLLPVLWTLPELNRMVLAYLIRFLQVFAAPENAHETKMDINNLSMVMAPNILRSDASEPRLIFENTRKEMVLVRILIENMDTGF